MMQRFQSLPSTIAAITLASSLAGGLSTAFAGVTITVSPEVIKESETGLARITAIATLNPCTEQQIPKILNCKLDPVRTEWLIYSDLFMYYMPLSGVIMQTNADGTQITMTPSAASMRGIDFSLGYHHLGIGIRATDVYGNEEEAFATYQVVTEKLPKPVILESCVGDDLNFYLQSTTPSPHYFIYYYPSNAPVPSLALGSWQEVDFRNRDSVDLGPAKNGIWYKVQVRSDSDEQASDFTDPVLSFCPIRFNEEYYLANNPDVAIAVKQGLIGTGWQHYQANGKSEQRSFTMPSGYDKYNELYYLANNPDVAIAVEHGFLGSGWQHYQANGQSEGRTAQLPDNYEDFGEKYYLANNPDVAVAVHNGLIATGWQHYQANGKNEGRSFVKPFDNGFFNEEYYLANNPDVAIAVEQGLLASGWLHYQANGQSEGRSYNYPY